MAAPARKRPQPKTYTALVYFHGIGEQRRYEEVSFLIDALEQQGKEQDRPLHRIEVQSEPVREAEQSQLPRGTVEYIRAWYKPKAARRAREYRFYEAYYADLVAGGTGPWSVFTWLLSLTFRPLQILFTRWRELPRLRRATLLGERDKKQKEINRRFNRHQLTETERQNRLKQLDEDTKLLLDVYDEFVTANQPPQFSKGSFWDYLYFVFFEKRKEGRFAQYQKLLSDYLTAKHRHLDEAKFQKQARQWRGRFRRVQVTVMILELTALLTLGLTFRGLVTLVLQIPHRLPWVDLGVGALMLLVLWGLSAFLRYYVGDLYFWSTYQETSTKHQKREAILSYCSAMLSHVLNDPNCERVVLVAHSMGTTVAHDTILRLRRPEVPSSSGAPNLNNSPLAKIQHFVTLASVIDKVYYLFESVISQSYRYNRVIETLRGDLGTFPFSADAQEPALQTPRIHWVNFWDRADVASSRLYTPANQQFRPEHVVDNFEVAGVCFPDPVSAHLDYTQNPLVLSVIADVFLENQANFVELTKQATPEHPADYVGSFFGKAEVEHKATQLFQALVLLCPWIILLRSILSAFHWEAAAALCLQAVLVDVCLIAAGGLLDWIFRFQYRRNLQVKAEAANRPEYEALAKDA